VESDLPQLGRRSRPHLEIERRVPEVASDKQGELALDRSLRGLAVEEQRQGRERGKKHGDEHAGGEYPPQGARTCRQKVTGCGPDATEHRPS
jgi:hypothetical protein